MGWVLLFMQGVLTVAILKFAFQLRRDAKATTRYANELRAFVDTLHDQETARELLKRVDSRMN